MYHQISLVCLVAVLLNASVSAIVEKIVQKEDTKSEVKIAGDLDSDTQRNLGTWSRWNKKKGKKKKDYSWVGGSGGYSKFADIYVLFSCGCHCGNTKLTLLVSCVPCTTEVGMCCFEFMYTGPETCKEFVQDSIRCDFWRGYFWRHDN